MTACAVAITSFSRRLIVISFTNGSRGQWNRILDGSALILALLCLSLLKEAQQPYIQNKNKIIQNEERPNSEIQN